MTQNYMCKKIQKSHEVPSQSCLPEVEIFVLFDYSCKQRPRENNCLKVFHAVSMLEIIHASQQFLLYSIVPFQRHELRRSKVKAASIFAEKHVQTRFLPLVLDVL